MLKIVSYVCCLTLKIWNLGSAINYYALEHSAYILISLKNLRNKYFKGLWLPVVRSISGHAQLDQKILNSKSRLNQKNLTSY